MDIKNMSVIELKALGFDLIAKLQQVQADIQTVNNLITKKDAEGRGDGSQDLVEKPKKK